MIWYIKTFLLPVIESTQRNQGTWNRLSWTQQQSNRKQCLPWSGGTGKEKIMKHLKDWPIQDTWPGVLLSGERSWVTIHGEEAGKTSHGRRVRLIIVTFKIKNHEINQHPCSVEKERHLRAQQKTHSPPSATPWRAAPRRSGGVLLGQPRATRGWQTVL